METLTELQNWLLSEGRRILTGARNPLQAGLTASQKVALSQQIEFQKRSRTRFPNPEKWLWNDRSLSQASDWLSACFKASLFPEGVAVVDGCCGAGADSVALANGRTVSAVDLDPWMVELTKSNASAHERSLHGIVAPFDSQTARIADWIHVDPDRRATGRKTLDDTAFSPSLRELLELSQSASGSLVKIAPSTRFSEPSEIMLRRGWVRLFLGSRGECRQQVLATGEPLLARISDRIIAKGCSMDQTQWPISVAVLLSESDSSCDLFEEAFYCSSVEAPSVSIPRVINSVGPLILDLNSVLFAANLHSCWAMEHDLQPVSDEHGYYSTSHALNSLWATAYEVIDNLPWDDRIVRKWINSNDVGLVEVKCRLVKIDANVFQRRYSRPNGKPISMLVTRIGQKVRCLVCRRVIHTRESCCP